MTRGGETIGRIAAAAAAAAALCALPRAAAAAALPPCAHPNDNFAAKVRLAAPDPLGLVSDGVASAFIGSPTAAVRVAEHFEVRACARAHALRAPAAGNPASTLQRAHVTPFAAPPAPSGGV